MNFIGALMSEKVAMTIASGLVDIQLQLYVIFAALIGAIFGGHVWIDLPAGLVSVEEGPRMAASSQITINVKGKQGAFY